MINHVKRGVADVLEGSDWISAQDIDNMYDQSPKHHNTMKRIMEEAESRVCNVTGVAHYNISVSTPMYHPHAGVCQLVTWRAWRPKRLRSDSPSVVEYRD